MIARQVRERGRRDVETGNAILRERVRRHFERDSRQPHGGHLAMQAQAVGRRQHVRFEPGRRPETERSEVAAGVAARGHGACDQPGDRGLAVRARHPECLRLHAVGCEKRRGKFAEPVVETGHRQARFGHFRMGGIRRIKNDRSASPERFRREFQTVPLAARHGDERCAGRHLTAVDDEIADLHAGVPGRSRPEQIAERHGGGR